MPEVRPIDANALLKKCIEGDGDNKFTEGYNFAVQEISAYITLAPTIEAEPVRHGRMIEGRYPNENKCSECGQIFRDDIQFIYPYDENSICKTPKRCPECGCYWEGGADNG